MKTTTLQPKVIFFILFLIISCQSLSFGVPPSESNSYIKELENTVEQQKAEKRMLEYIDSTINHKIEEEKKALETKYSNISVLFMVITTFLGLVFAFLAIFRIRISNKKSREIVTLQNEVQQLHGLVKEIDELKQKIARYDAQALEQERRLKEQLDIMYERSLHPLTTQQRDIMVHEAEVLASDVKADPFITLRAHALHLYLSDDYTNAIVRFRQMISNYPDMSNNERCEIYHFMAYSQNETKHVAEAIKTYKKILGINPGYANAAFNLAVIFESLDKDTHAMIYYDLAIAAEPTHKQAWNNKGILYGKKKNDIEAIKCFTNALSIDPDYIDAYVNIIESLIYTEKLPLAKKYLMDMSSKEIHNIFDVRFLNVVLSLLDGLWAYNADETFEQLISATGHDTSFVNTCFDDMKDWLGYSKNICKEHNVLLTRLIMLLEDWRDKKCDDSHLCF